MFRKFQEINTYVLLAVITCNFEIDLCDWTDIANNPLHKWQRKTADEIGEAPGPDTDHGMFIEWRNIIQSLSNT